MTKEKSPAVQWYPKQYLGDDKVLAMEWDARGMHHWLLNISWQQEPRGTIPNDTGLLRRWLNLPSNTVQCAKPLPCTCNDCIWRRVWPQIKESWLLQDGRFVNAGMLRAAQRQEAYSKRRTKDGKSPEDEEGSFDFDFELASQQIYELYPRKVKKPDGLKAIKKAIARELQKLGSVEAAVVYLKVQTEKYGRSGAVKAKKTNGEEHFIPHPASWFNAESYNDEADWSKSGSVRGTTQTRPRAGRCKEHGDCGAAADGSCWECYRKDC